MNHWDGVSVLRRDDEAAQDVRFLADRWAAPGSSVLHLDDEQRVGSTDGHLCFAPPAGALPDDVLYLGSVDGHDWFATYDPLVRDAESLRALRLNQVESLVATRAAALLGWHRLALPCERCGGPTRMIPGGASRVCTVCGLPAFARVDPAVIVGVLDPDDRLFLAHQQAWGAGRVSILAGFVEAGESAEQACHREVFEESHLRLERLRYVGSQPWPFPRSIMLGFVATTSDTVGQVDGVELAWGRFFSRADYVEQSSAGAISGPGHTSIAHRIVSSWLDGSLDAP